MAGAGEERALRKIAAAFEPLADVATSGGAAMELGPFSHACARVSVLFGCLGIAFKFAEKDYVAKAWGFSFPFRSVALELDLLLIDQLF